jgi:SH3-like domain-containing protein
MLKRAAAAILPALGLLAFGTFALTSADAQRERKTPYWASISASEAMMRSGPGRRYPATWRYIRADLPIKVVEVYPEWRKIQDPDGTTGWMLVGLLSATRTALVRGPEPRPMHEKAASGSRVRYLASPGVVGRLSECGGGWCRLDVGGKEGYIRSDQIWGVDPNESFD